jgi:hypothetical protein
MLPVTCINVVTTLMTQSPGALVVPITCHMQARPIKLTLSVLLVFDVPAFLVCRKGIR